MLQDDCFELFPTWQALFVVSNLDKVSLTASSQSLQSCVTVLPVILMYAEEGVPTRSL